MFRFFVCCISLLLFVGRLQGQDQKVIDSLHALLKGQSGAERFPALYELTFEYFNYDKEEALRLIEEAGRAADLSGDSLWIVKSRRVRGTLLCYTGKSVEGFQTLYDVLLVPIVSTARAVLRGV